MPTPFLEERFPESVSEGSKGGPGFSTTVFTSQSGFEQRNANWANSRAQYDISYGIRSKADLDDVLDFFFVMRGRATGFRFKDWGDYQITLGNIGTGDSIEDTFQVVKKYVVGANTYTRTITKIVTGTVEVRVNNVVVDPADYTLNLNTGVLVFDTPPGAFAITITCEFDVPVRFDVDNLPISWEAFEIESAEGILLVEVRIA